MTINDGRSVLVLVGNVRGEGEAGDAGVADAGDLNGADPSGKFDSIELFHVGY